MHFEQALEAMREGRSVARKGWNADENIRIAPRKFGVGQRIVSGYVKAELTWTPSSVDGDLPAEDWDVV